MAEPALSVSEFLASTAPLEVQLQRAEQRRSSRAIHLPVLLGRRLSFQPRGPAKGEGDDKPQAAQRLFSALIPRFSFDEATDDNSLAVLEGVSTDKYVQSRSLREALQGRDTVLIKGSWLVKHWRSAQRGAVTPTLPSRQELEAGHPAAIWEMDDLFRLQAKAAVNIVAVSHCWLGAQHPDPRGDNLSTLCRAIELMLQSTPVQDLALFIDYCSMYQAPRTVEQDVKFTRAMCHTHLWYLHQGTRVWMLTKVPDTAERREPYERRGWPTIERALGDMVSAQSFLLDLGKLDDSCTTWRRVLSVCKHQRRPPISPAALAEALKQKTFASKEARAFATHKYDEAFLEAIAAAKELTYSGLEWGDEEAKKVAQILPLCGRLEKVALHGNKITDAGAGALIGAAKKCGSLQELWLTKNTIAKAKKEVREKLFDAWVKTGRCEDQLHI